MRHRDTANYPQTAPILRRQLSASYTNPITGELTADDPSSYQGAERTAFENALLNELPDTGYAAGIRKDRRHARSNIPAWSAHCNDVFFRANPNNDDNDAPGASSIPVLA